MRTRTTKTHFTYYYCYDCLLCSTENWPLGTCSCENLWTKVWWMVCLMFFLLLPLKLNEFFESNVLNVYFQIGKKVTLCLIFLTQKLLTWSWQFEWPVKTNPKHISFRSTDGVSQNFTQKMSGWARESQTEDRWFFSRPVSGRSRRQTPLEKNDLRTRGGFERSERLRDRILFGKSRFYVETKMKRENSKDPTNNVFLIEILILETNFLNYFPNQSKMSD